MEDRTGQIETLFHRTEEYAKTSLELLRLNTVQKTTAVASSVITRLIVVAVISMCLLIFSAGVAMWLGGMFDKAYYGFFIVAAFYAVAGIFIMLFGYKGIKKRLSDSMIKDAL